MTRGFRNTRWGMMGGAALLFVGAAVSAQAQPAQQPRPAGPAPQPSAVQPPQNPVGQTPPEASQAEQRLQETLRARSGGLRADQVARRAQMSSPEVRAKEKEVEAAAAKVDQAAVSFLPQVKLLARYTRLSPLTIPAMGNIVGTQDPGPVVAYCQPGQTVCPTNAASQPFSFPVLLNMYTLQGTLGLPLSDYILRLSQNYASASHSKSAADFQVRATQRKVQRDARSAFYNWIRARGSIVVAEQGLATAQAHLKDVTVAQQVGSASKADQLRVESQVASTQLLVERSQDLALLVEEQLRVMLHDPPGTHYEIGEDVNAPVRPMGVVQLANMQAQAIQNRPEMRVLDESVRSLRETKHVVEAGYLPRLDAFADLYHQNPNTRVFPQQEKWDTTWDVGAQLSWTVNDTFTTSGQASELEARIASVESQRGQLVDGIKLEVTQAYYALRDAEVALSTTERQLAAAEESYRVRRELFRAGRATSAELTDAETDLTKSRFDSLNARIDVRVARANLDYALGGAMGGR